MTNLEAIRADALDAIIESLESDTRFVAAWLAGSFGRGEEDEYSDLDLWVVVNDTAASSICAQDWTTGAGAPAERLDIFADYGEPVLVYEQHANAPVGGTFTSVYYASGLAVDWTFVPLSIATRRPQTVLLFERESIAIERRTHQPLRDTQLRDHLAERYAFFWLLALPAAKSLRRRDDVRFQMTLEKMYATRREIEHLLSAKPLAYSRESLAPFCPTAKAQRDALVAVCQSMLSLATRIEAYGVQLPDRPRRILDAWISESSTM